MLRFAVTLGSLSLLSAACGDDSAAPVCTPGMSVACTGAGGCAGGQTCNAEGTAYGACDCSGTDAGPAVDAGPVADGGSDAGAEDGGPGTCDVVANTGCGAGERCAWAIPAAGTGEARCAPEGTVDAGEECTGDPESGLDDCRGGLVCVTGTCRAICALDGSTACPTNTACRMYSGLFEDEGGGVCDPICDPVTQERLTDGAAACGSAIVSEPDTGCYGALDGPFTCVPVAAAAASRTHGSEVPPPPYLNSCAPGHTVLVYDGTYVCVAFCTPGETYVGSIANRDGLSPHTCTARGATGTTEECRYVHAFQTTPNALGNEYGVCLDYARAGAPPPLPSCTTLPNTDTDGDGVPQHVQYGCGPRSDL